MFMVQDIGFTLKSTVTSALWFSGNGIALPCEIDDLPHEILFSGKPIRTIAGFFGID